MFDETRLSPNYGYPRGTAGRGGQRIEGVGVHISGGELAGNLSWISNPRANASYNVLVARDGKAILLVPTANAAWAHGAVRNSKWPMLRNGVNPNLHTLSIARVGSDQRKWDPPQMDTIVKIIKAWSKEFNFPAKWPNVFGHKHIDSVNRYFCPGDLFLSELYVQLATFDAEPEILPSNRMFRVIAGSYADRHNAEMVMANLRRMGVTGVFIDIYDRGSGS